MSRVRFVEPARLEVLAEVDYDHRVNTGLGTKFLEAVEDATAANNLVTCIPCPFMSLTLSPVASTEIVSYVASSYIPVVRPSFLELQFIQPIQSFLKLLTNLLKCDPIA